MFSGEYEYQNSKENSQNLKIQMSNKAQMTKCQNIFSFDKKIKDHTFSTLGLWI